MRLKMCHVLIRKKILKAPFPLLQNSAVGRIRPAIGCLPARGPSTHLQELLRVLSLTAAPLGSMLLGLPQHSGRTRNHPSAGGAAFAGVQAESSFILSLCYSPFKHILPRPLEDLLEKPHSFWSDSPFKKQKKKARWF